MTTIKNSIRKIVFGFLVAGSAIIGSAFTNATRINNDQNSMQWFELKAGGDSTNPAHYSPVDAPDCSAGSKVCAILAEPSSNPSQPNLATKDDNETRYRIL